MNLYSNSSYSTEIEGQLDLFGEMSNVATKDYTILFQVWTSFPMLNC